MRKVMFICLLFSALVFYLCLPASADSTVTLIVDGPVVRGNIETPGAVDLYKFTVAAPSFLRVFTDPAQNGDTVMVLFGPDDPNQFLGYNDDSGPGAGSSFTRLFTPGDYFIRVNDYYSNQTTTYDIQALTLQATGVKSLQLGSTVHGQLTAKAQVDAYEVQVPEVGVYAVKMTADFEMSIGMFGPKALDTLLQADFCDFCGDQTSNQIMGAGSYTILTANFDRLGSYSIAITKLDIPFTSIEPNGAVIQGNIPDRKLADAYQFTVKNPTAYSLDIKSQTLRSFGYPVMSLYGPEAPSLITTGYSGLTKELQPGKYYVLINPCASDYCDHNTGTYLLRLTSLQIGSRLITVNGPPLTGDFKLAGQEQDYGFIAASPGEYTIETFLGTNTDTSISLNGPNNPDLLIDDNNDKSSRDKASIITKNLLVGVYVVKVTSRTTGTYSIQVTLKQDKPQ